MRIIKVRITNQYRRGGIMGNSAGSKSHRLHSKEAIARKFKPGRRCWRFYWRIQWLIESEIELSYERDIEIRRKR